MTEQQLDPRLTAHEWVREHLRRDIMQGIYRPGDPLKQTELAARMQVSVTPVREAMRDLASEGIVVLDPQKVARVRSLDEGEARELNEIRYLLEPLAARRAASHATPEAISRIKELALASASVESDPEWLDSNHRLHLEIIRAANAPLLIGILENLRHISSIYLASAVRLRADIREKSGSEHLALADAIAARDGEGAMRIMRSHLFPSGDLVSRVFEHDEESA